MSIITDVLESVIVEKPENARIVSEIRTALVDSDVGTEKGGFATNQWLSGLLASRGSAVGKINTAIQNLNSGMLDPESKEYRDAVRTKIACEILLRHRVIKKDEGGRYTFPAPNSLKDKPALARVSELRRYLSSGFNADKEEADMETSSRITRDELNSNWAESLPPERKELLNAFREVTASAFTFLLSLEALSGPDSVAEFRRRINSAKFSESMDLNLLKRHGFVSDKGLLNKNKLAKFLQFANDPDGSGMPNGLARLGPFNPELSYIIKRRTADKALAKNAAGRELDHLRDPDAAQVKGDMTHDQNRAINSRISDIEGGTQTSTRNDRATDRKRAYSDLFKSALS